MKWMDYGAATVSVVVLATVVCETVQGGGFAILAQSGNALGNAFSNTADISDPSALWYNPAALGNIDKPQASLTVNAVDPSFQFRNRNSTGAFAIPGSGDGGDAGGLALVPQIYSSFPLNERWTIGLGLNSPFGLKTEYVAGWRGELSALKSKVITVNVNPSLAYRVTDSLWIGAGLNWQSFEAELTNHAGVAGIARLQADDTGWGYNAGMWIKFGSATRLSLGYRSSLHYDLAGDLQFSQAPVLNADASASMRTPESATVSIAHDVTPAINVSLGAIWTRWSRLEELTVVRTSDSPLGSAGSVAARLPFHWKDSTLLAIGMTYTPPGGVWSARLGVASDPGVSNDVDRTPRLPDADRLLFTLGGQYKGWERGVLSFAYGYELVDDATLNTTVTGASGALRGAYDSHAQVLSVQYTCVF